MHKKSLIAAIVVSVVVIAAGFIGYHYLQQYFHTYTVSADSSLVKTHSDNESSSSSQAMTLENIIHKNQKRVVQILVQDDNSITQGSGFIYNNKGDIITNAHVVEGAKKVTIKTADAKMMTGKVIGIGDKVDVAVIRVPKLADRSPVKIEKKHEPDIGDPIIALGSPLGMQNSVITGVIKGKHRDFTINQYVYNNAYLISAPITYGNSGGPLLNRHTGEVIAINSAAGDNANVGYSIPIASVMDMVTKWSKHPQDIKGFNGTVANDYNHGRPSKQDAEYIVNYFYKNIALRDYVTAYSILGSSWRSQTSYKAFRKGFKNTIDVSVKSLASKRKNNHIIVTAKVSAIERHHSKMKKVHYKVTYTVGQENNQLKLLKGSGEQLSAEKIENIRQLKIHDQPAKG